MCEDGCGGVGVAVSDDCLQRGEFAEVHCFPLLPHQLPLFVRCGYQVCPP